MEPSFDLIKCNATGLFVHCPEAEWLFSCAFLSGFESKGGRLSIQFSTHVVEVTCAKPDGLRDKIIGGEISVLATPEFAPQEVCEDLKPFGITQVTVKSQL